jgi:hypothetical protein
MNPADDAIVQGTVPISAKSDAPSVRFEVFSYTRPSHRTSGTWIVIGNDADPTDGFGAVWDTTTTLNQGGPGGSSVVVAAIALDLSGQPMARSTARVNVANFRIVDGQVVYPYYVVGTCDEGRCGLSLRSGPGFTEYPVTGMKFDNEELEVICQAHGETYHSASGGSSDIWDQLRSGDWVSDYFVDTPERGVFSPPLPVCP